MKRTGLLVILGIVLILGFWGCNGYNGLVTADQDVKKVWSNVETNYQRRLRPAHACPLPCSRAQHG